MKLKKEFQISLWEDFMDYESLSSTLSEGKDYNGTLILTINNKQLIPGCQYTLFCNYGSRVTETKSGIANLSGLSLIFTHPANNEDYTVKIENKNNNIEITSNLFVVDYSFKNTTSFINERKICDIASNSLENPRGAYNVVFKSKTDGTHTLTFDMLSRYWDQQEQDFIENPIIKHLYNEAKIKLHYKNKWYDLIIKNCQENSKEKKYSYTCEDLFIDELGRNGYNIEFSTELGGNVNTITELADEALKGSDWTVDRDNSVIPIQKISEPIYAYTFSGVRNTKIKEETENNGSNVIIFDNFSNPDEVRINYVDITTNINKNYRISPGSFNKIKGTVLEFDDIKYKFSFDEDSGRIIVEFWDENENELQINIYSYEVSRIVRKYINYQEINKDGNLGKTGVIETTTDTNRGKGEDSPQTIFICHTSAIDNKNQGIDYQFYYNENGIYETDDDGNFINTNPKYITAMSDELKEELNSNKLLRIQYSSGTHTFMPQYRGYRYVRSPKTEWLPKIKRQVTVYKDKENREYYGYQKTTYLSPEIAQNLLINSKPGAFDGYTGWLAEEVNADNVKIRDCLIEMAQYTQDGNKLKLGEPSYLRAYYFDGDTKANPTSPVKFTNLAFKNNLKNIGAITKGDRFVVRLKQKWSNSTNDPITNSPFLKYSNDTEAFSHVDSFDKDDYHYIIYQCNRSISYKELLNSSIENGIRFEITSRNGTFKGGDLFRYYSYIGSDKQEHLITPETKVESQTLIKNEYYYFTKDQYDTCNTEDDLQLSFKLDKEFGSEETIELEYAYRPIQFEKIATLEAKESNYFNIIQILNEKFECWADFVIEHEGDGAIHVNATGKREKKVVFRDYIGTENFAGFKYGINLDSIQRTVDSKEITTKTIVKANSNEFARNGSCNIANASQNPSGAQFIINLDYFAHQKVLNQFEIDNDLYVEEGGYLGYYTKLKRLNGALQEIEQELIGIESALVQANKTIQAANVGIEDFLEDINAINAKLANNYVSYNNDTNAVLYSTNPMFFTEDGEWKYQTIVTFYKTKDNGDPGDAYPPGQQIIYNITEGKQLVDGYNRFVIERDAAKKQKRSLEEKKAKLIAKRDGKYSYINVDGNEQSVEYKNGEYIHSITNMAGTSKTIFFSEPIFNGFTSGTFFKAKIFIRHPDFYGEVSKLTEPTNPGSWEGKLSIPTTGYPKVIGWQNLEDDGVDRNYEAFVYSDNEDGPIIWYNRIHDWSPDSYASSTSKDTFTLYIPATEDEKADLPNAILPTIKQLDSQFYSKYSRFIREGTWTSEDYTDDNLYYLDACSVAYTSAFPKTTYSISVVDIKNTIIPDELGYDYSAYDFNCGDFTTMEDTEFFGWKEDGITPYKEKVVISETEEHLDNISANKITVQNYKTQFDELFQRITAATQTLELKQGEYERASKVINVNGEINKTFLQNTLYNNSLIIENIGAQGTSMDERGFISIDQTNPMLMTRMVGGGIVVSEDGGVTWSTGISGKGINASMIKTGQLDVGKIKILNGNDISFTWDSYGISGFDKSTNGNYDFSKYTRMDRFGFYAVDGEVDYQPKSANDIWDNENVLYCLLKDKLRIGRTGSDAQVEIYGDIYANSLTLCGDTYIDEDQETTLNKTLEDINKNLDDMDKKINELPTSSGFISNVDVKENGDIVETIFTYSDNGSASIISSKSGGYILTNVGIGNNGVEPTDHNTTYACIQKDGSLIAYNAIIGGIIYAGGGQIGNWTLEKNHKTGTGPSVLFSDGTGMASRAHDEDPAFWAGFTTNSTIKTPWYETDWRNKTKFYVTNSGKLYAKDAYIDGKITAKSDSTLGNWTIGKYDIQWRDPDDTTQSEFKAWINADGSKDYLHFGTIAINNGTVSGKGFAVTNQGKVYATDGEFSGKIKATSGDFGGSVTIGGSSLTAKDIKDFHNNNLDTNGKVKVLSTNVSTSDGQGRITLTQSSGYTHYKIISGDSNLDLSDGYYTSFSCNNGVIRISNMGYFSDYSDERGFGAWLQPCTDNYDSNRYGKLYGIWYVGSISSSQGVQITSDINKKNSIVSLSSNYDVLFDNLLPRLYKYNNGTSNRYHTGFIAQEVKEALDRAEVDTQDFAALTIDKYINKDGEEREEWRLRYDEFVSLNTWQIQKLKTRVIDLETEISNLKLQLKNLQNS